MQYSIDITTEQSFRCMELTDAKSGFPKIHHYVRILQSGHICTKNPHKNSTKLHPNRKGNAGNTVQVHTIPWLYIWSFKYQSGKGSQPLEAIRWKLLDQAPARFQCLITAIQKYSITVDYRPGTELAIADTLYLEHSYQEHRKIRYTDEEIDKFLHTMMISDKKTEQLQTKTDLDQELQQLLQIVKVGWPEYKVIVSKLHADYSGTFMMKF